MTGATTARPSRRSRRKYGLAVNELNPDAGSGDEIEAIKANQDNPGPQAPDVIDVGFSFGPRPRPRASRAVQGRDVGHDPRRPPRTPTAPGRATTTASCRSRSTRPSSRTPPKDWADLLKPEYKGQVALAGDPRTSNQAIQAVYAAALANGGSLDDAQPGLDFFKQLERRRQLRSGRSPTRARSSRARRPIAHPLDLQRPGAARRDRRQPRRSRSSSRPAAASAASTSRPSASTRRTRTRRSSGWSSSTPTRASCCG